ncbi:transketolase family protein [Candidatus Woesearchaeota archaeon]|nr:MAG: transketolase family protein [Candidatus Woesearchaeota archaeon]
MNLVPAVYECEYDKIEKKPTRDGFGTGTAEEGRENKDVVVLCGDLADSTRASWFAKEHPDRFIEVGVAEQNMVGMAVGLALVGKIPYVSTYAVFVPGRAWDQIRISVSYGNFPVKIMGAHSGISVGPDGATHQALEDVAITRCLPNMTVIVPCDAEETRKAVRAAAKLKGPVYIRFHREKVPVITTKDTPFEIGKAQVYREGKDVAVIAAGVMVFEALQAAAKLAKEGIDVRVINLGTVKPIDEETVIKAARECGAVVTAEEHQVMGGIGSAVMEVLGKNAPVPVEMVGVQDRFGESGQPDELMEKFGLTSKDVLKAIKRVLERKSA